MQDVRQRLRLFLYIMAGLLTGGSLAFTWVENLTWGDALYFTVVTVATVGYGDIHPVTPLGKLLASVLILSGVGTFTGLVANITEAMVSREEAAQRLEKVNLVSGIFYSELGNRLMSLCVAADPEREQAAGHFLVRGTWQEKDFAAASAFSRQRKARIDPHLIDLAQVRSMLEEKHDLLLRLLENPQLLEHETFTDLLRATLHLREELMHRPSLEGLPESDLHHLRGDTERMYQLLSTRWLGYLKHLKSNYPYLFSLAVRLNPFDPERSVIVR